MKLAWEYELPLTETLFTHDYEGPIHVAGDTVYFATSDFELPSETRATNRKQRGRVVTIHAVAVQSGNAVTTQLNVPACLIPAKWAFVRHDDQLFLHCGHLLTVQPDLNVVHMPFTEPQPIKTAYRPRLLTVGDTLIFADATTSRLLAVEPSVGSVKWELDLKSMKPYGVGSPLHLGTEIACYGRDELNYVDPVTGTITGSLQLRHIDKLFSPVRFEDDLLLGYTNWSVSGVIRYRPSTGEVVWRYRRKSSGPSTYCRIYLIGQTVVWVKGETEIIGVDVHSGEERWTCKASPWLYTELHSVDGDLLFGTAGRDGFIRRIDGATGQDKWSVHLKNGCAFFDYYRDSAIVGDFDNCLHRLRLSDGTMMDRMEVAGPVVGDVVVNGASAYTVVWCSSNDKPPRLLRVGLESVATKHEGLGCQAKCDGETRTTYDETH